MFSLENNAEEVGPPDCYRDMHAAHPIYQILAPGVPAPQPEFSSFPHGHLAQTWWLSDCLVIAVLSFV